MLTITSQQWREAHDKVLWACFSESELIIGRNKYNGILLGKQSFGMYLYMFV